MNNSANKHILLSKMGESEAPRRHIIALREQFDADQVNLAKE
jgi:hypothetical protein